MNCTVMIDWKFVGIGGLSAVGIIFATKMVPEAAERVTIKLIDTCKEVAIAKSNR